MTVWLRVIGMQEDFAALGDTALRHIAEAELIIGGGRHIGWLEKRAIKTDAEIMQWPSPFADIIPLLEKWRGRFCVIIATGDPLWYGAASTLVRHFAPDEMEITPAVSGFQLAAARLGWPLSDIACLTVHGRKHEQVIPHLAPGARILVLAHDADTPMKLAALLTQRGYGEAVLTALGHIGSDNETRHNAAAREWNDTPPDFHITAIACPRNVRGFLPRIPGLPDDAFCSDGTMTKSEIRAVTLSRLAPHPKGLLWDLGCGAGSVGIEWMRAADNARAIGVDRNAGRLDTARDNALRLGVPGWQGVKAELPHGLDDLPGGDPDAVFIGGGLSRVLAEAAMARLGCGGRLVVNTVTLESEAELMALAAKHGGNMVRLAVARREQVADAYHAMKPLMPVLQWSWIKQ